MQVSNQPPLKLRYYIQDFGSAGFYAWVDGMKGVRVQGDTKEEARIELMRAVRLKIAYDYGIEPDRSENLQRGPEAQEQDLELTINSW